MLNVNFGYGHVMKQGLEKTSPNEDCSKPNVFIAGELPDVFTISSEVKAEAKERSEKWQERTDKERAEAKEKGITFEEERRARMERRNAE